MQLTAQVGTRGQITLPAEIRKAVGLRSGDTLLVRVEEGKVVLEPAVVLPLELYTEDRVSEFARAAEMSDEEVARARRRWGL
jgi:AbrB family looped-hinge helix DNA binding protein